MAIYYYCSDGTRVSENTINRKYSEALKEKHLYNSSPRCENCGEQAVHNDHTIARARCKVIHKTELIWNPMNFVSSCAKCHTEWENFKSGDWLLHNNVEERLRIVKLYDPEGYKKRIELTKFSL